MSAARQLPSVAGVFTRAAGSSSPSSWNAETRTVEVVLSTGAEVARRTWEDGSYVESLVIAPEAVDLSRADAGMSLLDSHNPYSMEARCGVVVPGSVRIERGALVGVVRLSRNALGETLASDLADGSGFNVSLGYRIDAFEWTDATSDQLARLVATRWTPFELSAVAIPADAGSRTRNFNQEDTMSQTSTLAPARSPGAPTADPAINERNRAAEIRAIGASVRGLDQTLIERGVSEGMTIAQFRGVVFDALVARQDEAPTYPHMPAQRSSTLDDPAGLARAMGVALANRGNSSIEVPPEARQFAHRSVVELARHWCGATGIRVDGKTPSAVLEAALGTRAFHSTADFSSVIVGSADVSLRKGYAQATDQLKNAASSLTAQNFRDQGVVDAALSGGLLKVNEHGEYKRTTMRERAETYRIETFGRIIGVTRQLLINDDLGAITNLPLALGAKARTFEHSELAAVLLANGILADGKAVFDAAAGNLVDGLLTVETIGKLRQVIRTQKGLDGEFLGLAPKFLIVGPSQETAAEKLVAQISASTVDAVNPFASRLTLLVEPRIEDDRFYLAADPSTVQSLIYAHLSGQEGPVLESRAGWDVDGVEMKIRLDFGAAWLDRAGWAMGTGEA